MRRSGLGKGLGALIPNEAVADRSGGQAAVSLLELPLSSIRPNPYQPRSHFDESSLSGLAASIREVGVLQPVLVRETGEGHYELIVGERRWRAAHRAGLQTIPAVVQVASDRESLERAVVENLHRDDLNPLEEAAAYQQLIEDFGLTHEELALRVGRSRAAVSNTLRLFQLPPSVQRLLAEGQLDAGHARALLGTPDRSFQETLARRAVAEGLSVRAVEEAVRARQGQDPRPSARQSSRSTGPRPAPLVELEELLAHHLDTRVTVEMGGARGRVVVEFANLDDLERIYRAMAGSREEWRPPQDSAFVASPEVMPLDEQSALPWRNPSPSGQSQTGPSQTGPSESAGSVTEGTNQATSPAGDDRES
ncbi:MAG: ParB/RepB/Spo0J family partition protein [Acidimicrobiales bacterium]|nr:ParB/RepB/Spo0J family partition protein [Acidimicrobiales bacterium]